MTDLETTLTFLRERSWLCIFLRRHSKRPEGTKWETTREEKEVEEHLAQGGNIGLVCGQESGVDVLDFDDLAAMEEMFQQLGHLQHTVRTGSGKTHVYVTHEGLPLPAKIRWGGHTIGEVQRGPRQYVVMPPSTHPDGGLYAWANTRIEFLPVSWRAYLEESAHRPEYAQHGDMRGTENIESDVWRGPDPEELLRRAAALPGARRRGIGVKFQCPRCREEGHDRSKDNAMVGLDGRWGCAFAPGDAAHRRAIGAALGVSSRPLDPDLAKRKVELPGDDWLQGVDLD